MPWTCVNNCTEELKMNPIEKLKKIEKEVTEALDKIPAFVAIGYPSQIRKAQELKSLLSDAILDFEFELLNSRNEFYVCVRCKSDNQK